MRKLPRPWIWWRQSVNLLRGNISQNKSLYGFCRFEANERIIHFWITWSSQIQSLHVPHPFASTRYLLSLGAIACAILIRGCVLIEHEGTFLCEDGEVTIALLLIGGLHLSETAYMALFQNMGLLSNWGEGCEENNLPRPVIPHTTSITVTITGCPQSLAVVDVHHRWGHHWGTDARTSHAASGALVTNNDSGTSANQGVSRTRVNTVSKENGESTKLFL